MLWNIKCQHHEAHSSIYISSARKCQRRLCLQTGAHAAQTQFSLRPKREMPVDKTTEKSIRKSRQIMVSPRVPLWFWPAGRWGRELLQVWGQSVSKLNNKKKILISIYGTAWENTMNTFMLIGILAVCWEAYEKWFISTSHMVSHRKINPVKAMERWLRGEEHLLCPREDENLKQGIPGNAYRASGEDKIAGLATLVKVWAQGSAGPGEEGQRTSRLSPLSERDAEELETTVFFFLLLWIKDTVCAKF